METNDVAKHQCRHRGTMKHQPLTT